MSAYSDSEAVDSRRPSAGHISPDYAEFSDEHSNYSRVARHSRHAERESQSTYQAGQADEHGSDVEPESEVALGNNDDKFGTEEINFDAREEERAEGGDGGAIPS